MHSPELFSCWNFDMQTGEGGGGKASSWPILPYELLLVKVVRVEWRLWDLWDRFSKSGMSSGVGEIRADLIWKLFRLPTVGENKTKTKYI